MHSVRSDAVHKIAISRRECGAGSLMSVGRSVCAREGGTRHRYLTSGFVLSPLWDERTGAA